MVMNASRLLVALFAFLFGSFSTFLLITTSNDQLSSPYPSSSLDSTGRTYEKCDSKNGDTLGKSTDQSRLLCWVMSRVNATDKREAIMETWGEKCDLLLFMLSVEFRPESEQSFRVRLGPNAHLVYLNMTKPDTFGNLWEKTRLAFTYVHETYGDTYDWVLKADDNTFVIMENLRTFLRGRNPADRAYYGCNRLEYTKYGYNDGGAGYVMSHINVHRFIRLLKKGSGDCYSWLGWDAEDVRLGQCLSTIKIFPVDTQDECARLQFMPYKPKQLLSSGHEVEEKLNDGLREASRRKFGSGKGCCSESAVSFHPATPQEMRLFQYLIYDLRVSNVKNCSAANGDS